MEGRINRIFLYYIAAFIWGIPGIILTIKGVRAYTVLLVQKIWWLLLIIFMTSLGLVLKQIPLIPAEFTASFYSGLGPMLIWAAYRFVRNGIKQ